MKSRPYFSRNPADRLPPAPRHYVTDPRGVVKHGPFTTYAGALRERAEGEQVRTVAGSRWEQARGAA